jgi:DNA-binding transcriptional MerR regulator
VEGVVVEDQKLFSVSAFAKLSRITVAMLHHYDKLGLLSPVKRGENNYRYYSITQLSEVNLIRTMQELGLSLNEIKTLRDRRTPNLTAEILAGQIEKIRRKIFNLNKAHELTLALLEPILSTRDIDESAITVQFLPAAPIVLGDWNTYREDEDAYEKLVEFYNFIEMKYPDIDKNRPAWGFFSGEELNMKMEGKHIQPQRYYFYNANGQDIRPAGQYAIGYARGGYGQSSDLYVRMRDYIAENNFKVSGNAYEEYPQNEICIADEANYLVRVMIAIN